MVRNANLAVFAFNSLGDGLLYLLMADNLRRNGFDVTYYGDIVYQMRHWFPQLHIKQYPSIDTLETELASYDLVIMSPPTWLRKSMTQQVINGMRQKWLLICQTVPETWRLDHTQRLQKLMDSEVFMQVKPLANASGSIRHRPFDKENVVEILLAFMQERMGLKSVNKWVEIFPAKHLQYRRNAKRIIVSPDSAGPEIKNWSKSAFLQLCRILRAKGYDPKIVVAPQNHSEWKALADRESEVPLMKDVGELAEYIYESAALIANDSGNGHLASFLNIPLVTIYRKRNPQFHWRPGWREAVVITPRLTIPLPKNGAHTNSLWKPFVSVNAIITGLNKALNQDC